MSMQVDEEIAKMDKGAGKKKPPKSPKYIENSD